MRGMKILTTNLGISILCLLCWIINLLREVCVFHCCRRRNRARKVTHMGRAHTIAPDSFVKYAPTSTDARERGFDTGTLRDTVKPVKTSPWIPMRSKDKKRLGRKETNNPSHSWKRVETIDESLRGFFFSGNPACQVRKGREAFSCLPPPQASLRKLLLEVKIWLKGLWAGRKSYLDSSRKLFSLLCWWESKI